MKWKTKSCYFLLFLSVILCVLAIISFYACNKQNDLSSKNTLRIGLALYSQEDTFISSIVQSLEKLAQQSELDKQNLKINLSIMDGKANQTTQMEQIDQLINRECDVLCVNIVDRTAASVLIHKAKIANIPIIFFNRQPVDEDIKIWKNVYYVGAKADEGGKLQGELVLEAWADNKSLYDKNKDNKIQYVMLEGEPGHQDALLRTEYSIKTLTDNDILVEKLSSDTANWNRGQAAAKTSEWISRFGDKIEVVFANNDDMALGAIDAFNNAGMPIPLVVGVDATANALDAIKNGVLYGTVRNDAEGISKGMLNLALSLYNKNNIHLEDEHYLWLPYKKIKKATLI